MKRIYLPLLLALSLNVISCGDRKTQKDPDEIQLEDQDKVDTQDEKAAIDKMPSVGDQNEINEAKSVINDYYGALSRSQPREAYDIMDPTSNRGSFTDFSEEQSKYENIEVSFTDEAPKVDSTATSYSVTLPLRYTGTTKDGNQETYSGTAKLMRTKSTTDDSSQEDGKYKISSLDMTREDS